VPVASVSDSSGGAFLIAAGLTYEAIAKACSSPQTAEINIDKRADTLMKWVNIGTIEALALVTIAVVIDRDHKRELLAGGIIAAAVTYAEYIYAKHSGLKNGGPGTET
jgi:hypothetical protein